MIHGLCDRDEIHDAHMAFPPDTMFTDHECPGQYSECRNCDDRKCMDCVLRYVHDVCTDNCPSCCR